MENTKGINLEKIIKRVINESGYKGGFNYSNFIDYDLIQDVIDRMNDLYCENCGEQYKTALKEFNKNWEIDPRRSRKR